MTHPLDKFGHCPQCGSKAFEISSGRSKKCKDCGFEFYLNPAASVAAIIIDERGRMMLTRRAYEPAKGSWDLPGGFAEFDESLEEALRREIKEELGMELVETRYFTSLPNRYEYGGMTIHTLDSFFICRADTANKPQANDDVEACEWKEPQEVDTDKIGLESIRKAVEKYKAECG